MIVIGVDTHKRTHALAAVDECTGRVRGRREIKAEEPGHLAAVRWARGLDEERVWAIEDCRHVSRRLEQALLAAGERVVRVAPHRMGASRKGERERGKSDQIDALAIARAVVKDGIEKFPVAYLDEAAMDIRLLLDHRNDLVAERTRTVNRLRWHLLQLSPELERSLKSGSLNQPRVLDRVDRRLRKLPACARVRVARGRVAQIRSLNRLTDELKRELLELVKAHRPQLLAETAPTAPAGPRRRPSAQPCAAHHRDHPRQPRPGHQGLPGTQRSRRQDHQGRAALPQAPPRQTLPPAPVPTSPNLPARSRHRERNPRPSRPARPQQRRHQHRRRRPNPDALRDLAVRPRRRANRPILRPAAAPGEHPPRTSPAANRRNHARPRPSATKRRVPSQSAALDKIAATQSPNQNAAINPPRAPDHDRPNPLRANTP